MCVDMLDCLPAEVTQSVTGCDQNPRLDLLGVLDRIRSARWHGCREQATRLRSKASEQNAAGAARRRDPDRPPSDSGRGIRIARPLRGASPRPRQ